MLEKELDIFFLSHELSDALSISKLWQKNNDSAILVLPSSYFIQALKFHEAAMMGFAEPGFVFHYPCLVNPLRLADLAYVIVHPNKFKNILEAGTHANLLNKLISPALDQTADDQKAHMEKALITLLDQHDIKPGKIKSSDNFPSKLAQPI